MRRRMVTNMVAVAVGAAVGANMRFLLAGWVAGRYGGAFPYGTLLINVLGSLLIGVVLGLAAERVSLAEPLRLLLVTGLLGGFTTFSTFSYETYSLIVGGNWPAAALYAALSVGLGLAAVILGVTIIRMLPGG